MKKQLLITLLTTLLLAAAFGSSPARAQGLVEVAVLEVEGTLGENGIYISDVAYSWTLPTLVIPETVVGCEAGTITQDTPAEGVLLECFGQRENGDFFTGVMIVDGEIANPIIRRDATPPLLELVSPAQNPTSANEGSSLLLEAVAQDVNPVTIGWDLDEDGTIDAPNPTSVTIPGLQGGAVPDFMVSATDEAGNVSQIVVEASIINLPPSIDGWGIPSQIHFGGAVQLEASTSDPGGDPLTARVDWGDNQLEEVVVKPDGTIQAEHVYAGAGDYQVTLILSDDEGLTVSDTKNVWIYSPVESIEIDLIPGTLGMVNQGILNQGQADSLVVKLEGAVTALNNDRPSAPQKLGAYLNEYVAVVPDGALNLCFLIATDVRDALILNGWVPDPD